MYQRFRIHGKGTVQKRSKDTYRIRFNLGWDHVSKKYRYAPWRTIYGSESDARKALDEYRREIEGGLRVDLQNTTFGEYASAFFSKRENSCTFARGTLENDRCMMKKLDVYLGDVRIVDIDSTMLIAVVARMRNVDHLGKKITHDLVAKIKKIIRCAMADGIVLRDPCYELKAPKVPRPRRNSLRDYEAARLLQILDASRLDRNIIAVYMGLATGMRRGEVLALTWDDVDFYGGAIRVAYSLDRWKMCKEPKSDAGDRNISIDAHTLSRLRDWKAIQAKALSEHGISQRDSTPVCANGTGGFCEATCFYNWFTNFCVDNGFSDFVDENGDVLPKRRFDAEGILVDEHGRRYSRTNRKPKVKKQYRGLKFHELRHTQATLLIANGVDIKTVQDRLGHAKASTTLDFYAHSDSKRDRQAAQLFGDILSAEHSEEQIASL
jgi:integrase